MSVNQALSTWKDRVRPNIILISPSGIKFTAGWKGDSVTAEKRVGQYNYPLRDGTDTQDMGLNGLAFPLTLYFEGADNDTDSMSFLRAMSERDVWTVHHPVLGKLSLQPVSAKVEIDPATSGNLTVVSSSWIEPVPLKMQGSVSSRIEQRNQVQDGIIASRARIIQSCKDYSQAKGSQTKKIASSTEINLGTVKKAVVKKTAEINAIINQINEEITAVTIDVGSLTGEVSALMLTPGLVVGSAISKVSILVKLGENIILGIPKSIRDLSDRNSAIVSELFITLGIMATAQAIIDNVPETRAEALAISKTFDGLVDASLAATDSMSILSEDLGLEAQYFGGRDTSESINELRASVARYMLSILFDLKTERRFTITRNRAPIEIAITEYGKNGWKDEYFDLFLRSNGLSGKDIILLPAGREVVIYG